MIPMGRLSTNPVYSDYLPPDDIDPENMLIDYELGGIALSNPTQGLQVQVWIAEADGKTGDISLQSATYTKTTVFTAPGVTEISLTFDQNMRPFFAYVQNGQAKFRWYNTVLGANQISDLGPLDYSPRCALDDKRDSQTLQGDNDIILAYMRGDSLYYRQQRDRYEDEYLLKSGLQARLLRLGMNKDRRLQFLLEETT